MRQASDPLLPLALCATLIFAGGMLWVYLALSGRFA